jgi:hypothetical protein
MALTAKERKLAAAVDFEEAICEIVKRRTGCKLSQPMGYTVKFKQVLVRGLSVAVSREDVERILGEVQPELRERGYRAFWSDIHSANGGKESDEIVVLKTNDPYAIVSLRCTNGANYDVSTLDVLERLKTWATRCQFHIEGAAESWVAISFDVLPDNHCAFAEEIFNFCPDVVGQGVGLLQEKDEPEMFKRARQLCPTLSLAMQKKLAAAKARFKKIKMSKELRNQLDQLARTTTSTDMGIRLLAYELARSKKLFLWWD